MEVGEGSDSSWTLKMEPKGLTEISAVEDERERGVGPTAEFRGRRKGAASHFPGWGCLGQEGSGAAGAGLGQHTRHSCGEAVAAAREQGLQFRADISTCMACKAADGPRPRGADSEERGDPRQGGSPKPAKDSPADLGWLGRAHSPLMPVAAGLGPHRGVSSQLLANCALPRSPWTPPLCRPGSGGGAGASRTRQGRAGATPPPACLRLGKPWSQVPQWAQIPPCWSPCSGGSLWGQGWEANHRHMQQRFSEDEPNLDSYCLHLFSAQEAGSVPTWSWGHTGPLPHMP